MDEQEYTSGQLVRLLIKNKCYTDDGFAVIETRTVPNRSEGIIYSEISLDSYPSCNDFFGESTVVVDGDLATILSKKGRPWQINSKPQWSHYDIYEILIDGAIRNIFKFNLEPIDVPTLIS